MRVLVTGGRGMLGTEVCHVFRLHRHDVIVTDIEDMDVRDPRQVRQRITRERPDLIVHLAAWTDVDACERQPDEALRANTLSTQYVALACQTSNIPLVYLSTISVFDGTKSEAYTELDTPNPQSWYSRSKYEGERTVMRLLRHFYIVRAGWMFGGGHKDKKFVAKIIEQAQQKSQIKIVNDRFGSPVYTVDLAQALVRLVSTGQYGLYHLVNTGEPVSRFEVAQATLEFAGITTCQLYPVSSAEFPLAAPRPRMEAARNWLADLIGLPPMRPWRVALEDYVRTTFPPHDD